MPTEQQSGAAVVIAAYNEAKMIGEVVADVRRVFDQVIVVDDGSRDGTARIARDAGATVLVHPINLGQGAALQTGIAYALRLGAEQVVTFDADGQHRPEDALNMIAVMAREEAQVVLGSRFLGATENMPVSRRLLLRAATVFTRLTTGLKVTDAHNGLRLLRADAAASIRIRQNRMAHASEILEEIARHGLSYVEAPVVVRYTEYSRAKGQSGFGAFNILLDLLLARMRK
ncbi:glycosyltransferase family 2 protein [Cognatilysobacter tabacisoli]|uniref:glycosyltransferase family 2 protein n=1 Tax=Cognatilysobacter tabacisoli TaxID=2315424 RepID=UPI000E6B23EB|nr:glycosyltransferase family 2 protein [Lysobacter tabacisoli]